MNLNYRDILSRIAEPPQWFDESAVPRFVAFSPSEVADIYADEVVLAEIACQSCARAFHVAFSSSPQSRMRAKDVRRLSEEIKDHNLHYGDPPNVDCCAAGPTMNSEPKRVLEYWMRENFEWVRKPVFEVDIEPEWVKTECTGHSLDHSSKHRDVPDQTITLSTMDGAKTIAHRLTPARLRFLLAVEKTSRISISGREADLSPPNVSRTLKWARGAGLIRQKFADPNASDWIILTEDGCAAIAQATKGAVR